MFYIYVLKNLTDSSYYVGMSKDINKRLKEHNRGKSKYTKSRLPWKIIYSEGPYETKKARKLEKYYKSTAGKIKLKKLGIID